MGHRKDTSFTKKCITEAIIELMEKIPYEKIRVSDVIKRAGIARMTFYNHYESIYGALKDYLKIIIKEYMSVNKNKSNAGSFFEYDHILQSLEYFHQYRKYFLTLAKNNLHNIMLETINHVMQLNPQVKKSRNIYAAYCYAGGLLNTFLKWEENGCKEDVSEVAGSLYLLCHE